MLYIKNRKIILSFLGPAFITAIGYIDPGNFATNIQSGAAYGYKLLWVVILANIMAMLIQFMSAKLGIATGKNLAEHIRDYFPSSIVWFYWIQAEIIAIATDLAEFIGASIGFKLVFGVSLLHGCILTAIFTCIILSLQNKKKLILEFIIAILLLFVACSYIIELFLTKPNIEDILKGMFFPSIPDVNSVVLISGILGATVMPHVIYLHSSLTQISTASTNAEMRLKRYYTTKIDIIIAMTIAGFINLAIMAMAASAFHFTGYLDIKNLEQAYLTLQPLFNKVSATIFGLSLLISGLASTVVGTLAGQVIMQGFIHFYIPIWLRRIITMLPSFFVILMQVDPMKILIFSQILLSFGIILAIFPLLLFTNNNKIMGDMVNSNITKYFGFLVAILVLVVNVYLLMNII